MAREGLGAGYADFRTHMDVRAGVGCPGDAAADGIDYAEHHRTAFGSHLDRGKSVGGFSALRDGKNDVSGAYHGIAVSEFARVGNFYRNAAELFDELLAYEGGVP